MIPRLNLLLFGVLLLSALTTGCKKDPVASSGVSSVPPTNNNSQAAKRASESETAVALLKTEPKYLSEPYYCRIAIGPSQNKVIVTAADIDDMVVYCDLNGNGDLTEDDEWFELEQTSEFNGTRYLSTTVPEIAQGGDIHTDLKIKYGHTAGVDGGPDKVKAVFSMMLWGWDPVTTDADLVTLKLENVKTDLSEVPLLHFNGPLTMGIYRNVTEMPRGEEMLFYSLVGTAGESGGTLTAVSNTSITDDAHPKVEFEFPHKESGKPPIRVSAFLMTRC